MAFHTVVGKTLTKSCLVHKTGWFKASSAQPAYIAFVGNGSVKNIVHHQAQFFVPHLVTNHTVLIRRASGPERGQGGCGRTGADTGDRGKFTFFQLRLPKGSPPLFHQSSKLVVAECIHQDDNHVLVSLLKLVKDSVPKNWRRQLSGTQPMSNCGGQVHQSITIITWH